jgi:hypothetical protein
LKLLISWAWRKARLIEPRAAQAFFHDLQAFWQQS